MRFRPWAGLPLGSYVSIRWADWAVSRPSRPPLQRRPQRVLVRALVAVQHRLGVPPATQLAEHLQRLVHQVRRELPPKRVPPAARLAREPGPLLRLPPPATDQVARGLPASVGDGSTAHRDGGEATNDTRSHAVVSERASSASSQGRGGFIIAVARMALTDARRTSCTWSSTRDGVPTTMSHTVVTRRGHEAQRRFGGRRRYVQTGARRTAGLSSKIAGACPLTSVTRCGRSPPPLRPAS